MERVGRIVTIGPCTARRVPGPGRPSYAMSTSPPAGLAKALGGEPGGRGITADIARPGPVGTGVDPADGPFARRSAGDDGAAGPLLPCRTGRRRWWRTPGRGGGGVRDGGPSPRWTAAAPRDRAGAGSEGRTGAVRPVRPSRTGRCRAARVGQFSSSWRAVRRLAPSSVSEPNRRRREMPPSG
ncbi:hypothetical protein GCM10010393_19940 [Streptomyces gobitricini]|uniref:Uncharacterized protein n=1 Tax=Streptomyces gobitricini TaxID=68211 RepID=A0ABN3LT15_9ACTN